MALHRQGSGSWQAGVASVGSVLRFHDYVAPDQKSFPTGRQVAISRNTDASGRSAMKQARGKRAGRTARGRQCRLGLFVFLLLCVVALTILGGDYLFSVGNMNKSQRGSYRSHEFLDNAGYSFILPFWFGNRGLVMKPTTNEKAGTKKVNWNNLADRSGKSLFGKGSVGKEEFLSRDSRDWDKDDRRRDRYVDYDDEDSQLPELVEGNWLDIDGKYRAVAVNLTSEYRKEREVDANGNTTKRSGGSEAVEIQSENGGWQKGTIKEVSGGWYNERGRKELRMYEEQLEAEELDSQEKKQDSVLVSRQGQESDESTLTGNSKEGGVAAVKQGHTHNQEELSGKRKNGDSTKDQFDMEETRGREKAYEEENGDDYYDDDGDDEGEEFDELESHVIHNHLRKPEDDSTHGLPHKLVIDHSQGSTLQQKEKDISKGRQAAEKRTVRRRRSRRHRHAGLACDIEFRNSTKGLREPGDNPKFTNFSLKYIEEEETLEGNLNWEPSFGGHQLLKEREQSFRARDQTIHCGFVRGANGSSSSGFDLAEEDAKFLATCRIAVSSCNFGNWDSIRSPRGKKFTGPFKKEVCFVMFVDQRTLEVMIQEDQGPDNEGYVGLWKIVIVRNLPYLDARRNGKIPKFLTHRLFPAARYSIWLDSKLRLQSDPVLVLEYFLWRGGYEYAISNHYDRHCVWEEVQQNKKLNKFNHTVIDEQFAFYQADGLTKFNASDPNKLLPSYVPEGSFIVRAHTPMSNLFSCLWFNEVDRFTPRDQLSFAYTYLKLVRMNSDKWFHLHMFKDCERRTIAKLFRHRRNALSQLQRQEDHAMG